jgi:hypothetical protein
MSEERESLEARIEVLTSEIEEVNRSLGWIGFFVFCLWLVYVLIPALRWLWTAVLGG